MTCVQLCALGVLRLSVVLCSRLNICSADAEIYGFYFTEMVTGLLHTAAHALIVPQQSRSAAASTFDREVCGLEHVKVCPLSAQALSRR